ncbi:uncharacterized protein N7477_004393 [Penicillium maclennaniae]|uniref:uncharacterized protein n=1 Tax=Penicillium maclennaniae TaxID=1343394 RepID=UPI002541627A|nr:uncharacterized protein N7477_004393 [Penicillium maclennaniae]KAJ5674459.1 hypothetical protein N7477_004393 [Penicillium maclennaniae]
MSGGVGPSAMPSTSASFAQTINNTVSATSGNSIIPSSPLELLTLPIRAFQRAETFAFSTVPRHVARLAGIEDVTVNLWSGPASTASDTGMAGEAAAATANMAREAVGYGDSWYATEFLQTMRKVGGFFGYLTSVWAFACLVEALILNRITIYASTRRHLRLGWERRLALRIIPILLFVSQILSLLRGIRCQTSPEYSSMRYGKPGKSLIFDYASGGGALHSIASTLLPWESDERACSAVSMGRDATNTDIPFGSFSLLWPVFLLLCLSHFVETLSCALQGRPVMTETGMSIFEHSLAFAEAESMIGKSIGLGLFGLPKQSPLNESGSSDSASPLQLLTRAQVLDRMNATPELLLIVLISCLNSLSSHVLDVFGKQSRYRLFNTAFWGFCFMAAMSWGMESGPPVSLETGVLRFPTVCIVGFVPHLLVLFGIATCFAIYGIALLITAFSLPFEEGQPASLRERFALAHENMQGSNQIRNIHINRHEDFYTTLLRVGYVALTAASEAVFLNEGKAVVARQMTWLEKDRLAEIEASRRRNSSHGNWPNYVEGSPLEAVGFASFELPDQPSAWESGYNREKKLEKPKNGSRQMRPQAELGGVGAVRASVRLWHGISFLRSIFWLIVRWISYGFNRALDRLGIGYRPMWLKRQAGKKKKKTKAMGGRGSPGSLDFWILTDEGELELPDNHDFDVELEMRKRERSSQLNQEEPDERRLDEKLYAWWRAGGSWGDQDHTPDFDPSGEDDDTTSVISMSTNASEPEWEDYASDGQSTPQQDALMDLNAFARLLDPRDRETREEARILAAHLSTGQGSGRIMTRSQYQQQVERERSRVLLSSRLHHNATNSHSEHRKPSAEEEAEMLERLILSRRAELEKASNTDPSTWESGAMGLGENGPPCVVCQTSPRSIITWPCRCLCICEDCRVSLAMNNFGSCVTCRQEVGGFMRLWVP